jgi:hypothetical protein
LSDCGEFKKIAEESKIYFINEAKKITSLRQEIKQFRPVGELIKIMKKLRVPDETSRLLHKRIVSKYA